MDERNDQRVHGEWIRGNTEGHRSRLRCCEVTGFHARNIFDRVENGKRRVRE